MSKIFNTLEGEREKKKKMGNVWSTWTSKHIIYIHDQKNRHVPIVWPRTYYDFLLCLKNTFDFEPQDDTVCVDDASQVDVYVKSEESFRALIPKHTKVEPNQNIFYVNIHL